jgi:hypothetical protein
MTKPDKYTPTEEQISRVLAKGSPREIAIAYLRAARRARQAESVSTIMEGVADLSIAAMGNDADAMEIAVNSTKRRIKSQDRKWQKWQ